LLNCDEIGNTGNYFYNFNRESIGPVLVPRALKMRAMMPSMSEMPTMLTPPLLNINRTSDIGAFIRPIDAIDTGTPWYTFHVSLLNRLIAPGVFAAPPGIGIYTIYYTIDRSFTAL
jgi:hypothetical protein